MRDPLKNYIDDHRAELDTAVPSDKLWTNIENAMIITAPAAGISSSVPWLRYFGFGLSSVAGAALIYLAVNSSSAQPQKTITVPVSADSSVVISPEQVSSATVTPTGFLVMNTTVLAPPPNEVPPPVNDFIPASPAADSLPPEALKVNAAVATGTGDTLFNGIKRVEVVAGSATVIVRGTSGSAVEVTPSSPLDSSVKLEYKRVDTTLQVTITVSCKKTIKRRKRSMVVIEGNVSSPELTLNIPAGTSIVVQNSYGNTKISGINAPVCEVRSSSGHVQVSTITASTNLATSYGNIDARDITGNLTARLTSGHIITEHIAGNVDVTATYGDQTHTDITGNLKASGSSGNINISKLHGDVNANTTYGYIQISDSKGSAKLVSSSGSIIGDKVELTANSTFITTYGDVNVALVNPLQDLSFDLATTYGDILIDKNGEVLRNEKKLNLTRGNILVKATSSSGDQVFR